MGLSLGSEPSWDVLLLNRGRSCGKSWLVTVGWKGGEGRGVRGDVKNRFGQLDRMNGDLLWDFIVGGIVWGCVGRGLVSVMRALSLSELNVFDRNLVWGWSMFFLVSVLASGYRFKGRWDGEDGNFSDSLKVNSYQLNQAWTKNKKNVKKHTFLVFKFSEKKALYLTKWMTAIYVRVSSVF